MDQFVDIEVPDQYVDIVVQLKLEIAEARSELDDISHSHRLLSEENSSLRVSLSSVTLERDHLEAQIEMMSDANFYLKEKSCILNTEHAELLVHAEVLQFECTQCRGYERLYKELKVQHNQCKGNRDKIPRHPRNTMNDKRSQSLSEVTRLKSFSRFIHSSFDNLCDKGKESDDCLNDEQSHTVSSGSTRNSPGSKKLEHSKDHTLYAGLTNNSSGSKNMKIHMSRDLLCNSEGKISML